MTMPDEDGTLFRHARDYCSPTAVPSGATTRAANQAGTSMRAARILLPSRGCDSRCDPWAGAAAPRFRTRQQVTVAALSGAEKIGDDVNLIIKYEISRYVLTDL